LTQSYLECSKGKKGTRNLEAGPYPKTRMLRGRTDKTDNWSSDWNGKKPRNYEKGKHVESPRCMGGGNVLIHGKGVNNPGCPKRKKKKKNLPI